MAQAKISLLGMYGYFAEKNEDLFEYLVLPEGMDKETFTDTLFLDYGERAVLYSNPDMLQRMIGTWSSKWSLELSRIAKTLLEDYEPLWNIDRYEDVTDKTADKATENISGTLSATNGTTNAQTIENTTSAYNSSQYEPDNKSQVNGSGSENISQTSGSSKGNKFDRDFEHDGHYFGNGGVTSSQALVREEISLREKYNLYHEACKLFSDDLLLYIY